MLGVGAGGGGSKLQTLLEIADPFVGGLSSLPGEADRFDNLAVGMVADLPCLVDQLDSFVLSRFILPAVEQIIAQPDKSPKVFAFAVTVIGFVFVYFIHLDIDDRHEGAFGHFILLLAGIDVGVGRFELRMGGKRFFFRIFEGGGDFVRSNLGLGECLGQVADQG